MAQKPGDDSPGWPYNPVARNHIVVGSRSNSNQRGPITGQGSAGPRQTPSSLADQAATLLGAAKASNVAISPTSAAESRNSETSNYTARAVERSTTLSERVVAAPEIRTKRTVKDEAPTNKLKPEFQKRKDPQSFFRYGRVFMMVFAEANGYSNKTTIGTDASFHDQYGEEYHCKVRRFIVIREGSDYCTALPIVTYSKRGCGKPSAKKSEHGVVYIGKTPPIIQPDEMPGRGEEPMQQIPIRIDPDRREEKLDEMSRLCYAKPYTAPHYSKVRPVGMVNRDSKEALHTQFDIVWRQSVMASQITPRGAAPSHGRTGSSVGQGAVSTAMDSRSQRQSDSGLSSLVPTAQSRSSQLFERLQHLVIFELCANYPRDHAYAIWTTGLQEASSKQTEPLSDQQLLQVAVRTIVVHINPNEQETYQYLRAALQRQATGQ